MEKIIIGDSFANAYHKLLHSVYYKPEYECAPRGLKIKEITDVYFTVIDPISNLFKNDARCPPARYLAGEFLWYFSGSNDLAFISKYSKFWKHITNTDGTCNSAYGYQLWNVKNEHGFTEWEWAKQSLISSEDSRQAIMRFNKPVHSFTENKDFVCTLNSVFQIRENKLKFFVNMRSSDCIKGLTFDFPFFSMLQQAMLLELHDTYPNLEIGSLTMLLNSSHVYENDFTLTKQMLNEDFTPDELPLMSESLVNRSISDMLNGKDNLSKWIAAHA